MLKNLIKRGSNSYTVTYYKKIWPYVTPYKARALVAVLISVPLGALDAVVAWSLKPFMDGVLIDKSVDKVYYIPLFILGFTFIQAFLGYVSAYTNTWVGNRISNDLIADMYKKLLSFETRFFDLRQTGEIITRFHADAVTACSGLLTNLKLFIVRLFSSLSLICVLFYHSWQLAIVAVIVMFGALYPLSSFRRRVINFNKEMVEKSGQLTTNYTESVTGNRIVSSYNLQESQINKFMTSLNRLFRLNMKMTQRTAILPAFMTISAAVGIATIIWYGSFLIVSGDITGGAFVSFIAALVMLYNPIKNIANNFSAVQISLLAMERIFELAEQEPAIKDAPNAKELKSVEKGIEFKNVDFEYEEGKPVLKGINLSIPKGKVYAFVGNSGGGKSSLVNLIPRFYEVKSGSVEIDGIDVKDITLKSLRENVAVVFQDSFLFNGTIRDNIVLNGNYTDEEVYIAIKSAYLEGFVNSLEKGIDTEVGERGVMLSGGQKQRISIARAILKNSPIVVLDEATSALDTKSEKFVQKALDKLMEGKTVLVVAHRLSTIRNADQIVVVNEGEIAEQGTHEELVKNENGLYTALYSTQAK